MSRRANPPRVLIIDDDAHVGRSLRRTLGDLDYQVTVATSAAEAIAALRCATFDVVISDENLGETRGSGLLHFVRCHYPTVARLLMTAHPEVNSMMRAARDGGVDRVLVKPCDPDELRRVVSQALEVGAMRTLVREHEADVGPTISVEWAMVDLGGLEEASSEAVTARPPSRGHAGLAKIVLRPFAPAAAAGRAQPPPAAVRPPSPSRLRVVSSDRVLVVDDDPHVRRLIDRTLRSAGYDVDTAHSAAAALELIASKRYVLALFDVSMPRESGIELARRVRSGAAGERNRELPIIFVTADESLETYEATFEVAAYRMVQKPVDADLLRDVLHGALHAGA